MSATSKTAATLGNDYPRDSDEPLTGLVRHHVRQDKHEEFKKWSQDTNALVRAFDGFVNAEVIRPANTEPGDLESTPLPAMDEYVAILRFDNYAHLNVWMKSAERKAMIDRISEFTDVEPTVSFHSLEHWFVSANDAPKKGVGPPAKWKMLIVTVVVIYLQTLWIPKVTRPIIPKSTHPYIFQLFNIVIVVLLATFVLLPVVTRLLSFWLTPGVNYRTKLLELVPSSCKKSAD